MIVTTHLMEEAERCDRLAILNEGKLVALGTPAELKSEIGGDVIWIEATGNAGRAGRTHRVRFSGSDAMGEDEAVGYGLRKSRDIDSSPNVVEAFPR